MWNTLPCLIALIDRNFACASFACTFNCPVIVLTSIYHFTTAIAAMQDINQRKHTIISADYGYILIFEFLCILAGTQCPFILYPVPCVIINDSDCFIRFIRYNPVFAVQGPIFSIDFFSAFVCSTSRINRICQDTCNSSPFPVLFIRSKLPVFFILI